jgi:hypothetical protein
LCGVTNQPSRPKSKYKSPDHEIRPTLWNDLDRPATLRAEYRNDIEVGGLALAPSVLLAANSEAGGLVGAGSP